MENGLLSKRVKLQSQTIKRLEKEIKKLKQADVKIALQVADDGVDIDAIKNNIFERASYVNTRFQKIEKQLPLVSPEETVDLNGTKYTIPKAIEKLHKMASDIEYRAFTAGVGLSVLSSRVKKWEKSAKREDIRLAQMIRSLKDKNKECLKHLESQLATNEDEIALNERLARLEENMRGYSKLNDRVLELESYTTHNLDNNVTRAYFKLKGELLARIHMLEAQVLYDKTQYTKRLQKLEKE